MQTCQGHCRSCECFLLPWGCTSHDELVYHPAHPISGFKLPTVSECKAGLQGSGVLFFFFLASGGTLLISSDYVPPKTLDLHGCHFIKTSCEDDPFQEDPAQQVSLPQAPSTQLACSTAAVNAVPGSTATHKNLQSRCDSLDEISKRLIHRSCLKAL